MKLHEYQAKEIFRKSGIPVPDGQVVESGDEAMKAVGRLKGPPWVVKAQVHAGGRGKGGGIRVVDTPEKVRAAAESILGNPLITAQTGPEGKKVSRVLVEEGLEIDRELYLAMVIDRAAARPVMIFSQSGGMEIEIVAEKSPELMFREFASSDIGWAPFMGKNLAYRLNPALNPGTLKELMAIMGRLYDVFVTFDCSLAEINPLVVTRGGKVMAVDAKMDIDDNALFRQKEIRDLEDPMEKDPLEREAEKYNLSYIRLDGNIGAMVNGAGLAMATMDLIKLAGAKPANFLDVGGGASQEMVRKGLEIILKDENVKAILINIFGGILRCDVLAKGVLAAAKDTDIQVPLIVRLEGTNVEEGRRIFEESDLKFMVARDMTEAAEMITGQIGG